MTKLENIACCIARHLGTCSGWCSARLPDLKHIILHYVVAFIFVTITMIVYVEIGHDKGWIRADTWYTCLHTHHHFGL